jgi:hypothetical protein
LWASLLSDPYGGILTALQFAVGVYLFFWAFDKNEGVWNAVLLYGLFFGIFFVLLLIAYPHH